MLGLRCDIAPSKWLLDILATEEGKERRWKIGNWNRWRARTLDRDLWLPIHFSDNTILTGVDLSGIDFRRAYLRRVDLSGSNLRGAQLEGAHLQGANLSSAHLEGANLMNAHLEWTILGQAHLEGANLRFAHLSGPDSMHTMIHLEGADLRDTYMEDVYFECAYMQGADFRGAFMEGAELRHCKMEHANLEGARLGGTCIVLSDFRSASFRDVHVNGKTRITKSRANHQTDFTNVSLDACLIDAGLKQDLEYARRRIGWESWYRSVEFNRVPYEKNSRVFKWAIRHLVAIFWLMSDYGRSEVSILKSFFGWSIVFALIYWIGGDGMVHGLIPADAAGNPLDVPYWMQPARALYFSLVTMTTLGFGDMHADPGSICGYLFVTLEVLMGYVLLGALVTRLSVLFTAGGPAGDMEIEESSLDAYLREHQKWLYGLRQRARSLLAGVISAFDRLLLKLWNAPLPEDMLTHAAAWVYGKYGGARH